MSDRFAPNYSKVKPIFDMLRNTLKGGDEHLIKAFLVVAHPTAEIKSITDVQSYIAAMMDMAPTIPWVLYDTIAELIKYLPLALKEALVENIKIETGHRYERLRITIDGHWQIAWEIDPSAEPSYKEVALSWYISPNQSSAPIVPLAIIDCIASSVLLLREDLVLPAATTLSIALEAALWDALEYSGFSRYSDQITYSSVQWNMKKMHDKFVVSINGADKSIKDLSTDDGSPFTKTIELKKMQASDSAEVTGIKFDVDKNLARFLVSDQVKKKEQIKDKGFSIAIQKARKERIKCLEIVPEFLDKTLLSLRNNLVHLPSRGKLDNPIPIEGQTGLQSVDDLRTNTRFVRFILYTVINIINTVYADQVQSIEEETNTKPAQALTDSTKKNGNRSNE